MINLLNNSTNNKLAFNINVEGVEAKDLDIRMLMVFENHQNYLFSGRLEEGKVIVDMPVFKGVPEGENGQLKLEVIANGEYFQAWKSDFTIKTKTTVKLTESTEIVHSEVPVAKKITLQMVQLETPKPTPPPAVVAAPVVVTPMPTPAPVKEAVKQVVKKAAPDAETEYPLTFEDFMRKR